jgi:hypothetical protein
MKSRVSSDRSSHLRTPVLGLLALPEQHDFARNVVLAGGEYHVARSIDDVQRLGL